MKRKFDYLIVGSGLYGCCAAYVAHRRNYKCLVIDKRNHLGGNLYCENIEGINIHTYGAHIFHTSNKKVWDFVNSIVEFNRYTNSPVANYKGRMFNLPFNMNTFYQMWGVKTPMEAEAIIAKQRQEALTEINRKGYIKPRNLEEQALLLVGRDIYNWLIKGYTEKQWGRECVDLPSFIIQRLPFRFTFDNNYFNDKYQGIPIGGYNSLIKGLLSGVDTLTNTDFFANREYWESIADKIIYTGPIDQFYNYKFGYLQYRTIKLENEILDISNYQGNAVINFTDVDIPYTRVIEHKHFEMFGNEVNLIKKTVVSHEYSLEWKPGMEPYYPINDEQNSFMYSKYKELTSKETCVAFGGRLAEYKYYDMAPIIEQVLALKW